MKLYVSTTGSDAAAGTLEAPLATLAGARDKIRTLQPLTEGVQVEMLGGTYRLTEAVALTQQDSGTATYPITYQPYGGAEVRISGSSVVTGSWTTHSGEIKYIDLPGQAQFNQLLVGGVPAIRARTPNVGSYYLMEAYGVGEDDITDYYYATPADLPTIGVGETIEVNAFVGFLHSRSFIDSIEVSGTPRKVNTMGGPDYGYNYRADYGRYFYEGSLSFLDQAGEFYWDDANERLYYWPRAGEVLGTTTVEIPQTDALITVTGSANSFTPAHDYATFSAHFTCDYSSADAFWEQCIWSNKISGTSGVRLSIRKQAGVVGFPFVSIGATTVSVTGTDGLSDGQPHHFALVVSLTTLKVYVDGAEVHSQAFSDPDWGTDAPRIGSKINEGDTTWNGTISQVIVLDKECTAGEVLDLDAKDHTGLSAYFQFHLPLTTDFNETTGAMGDVASLVRFDNNDGTATDRAPTISGGEAVFDGADDFIDFYDQPGTRAEYITFKDLIFEASGWELLAGGHWDWESGYIEDESKALYFHRANNCRFINCTLRNVGGTGVVFDRSKNCTIHGNTVYNIGGSGIVVQDVYHVVEDVQAGTNTITRNTVHDVGLVSHGGTGIHGESLINATIENNTVYNAPYCGIRSLSVLNSLLTASGSNYIAWNHIRDCMQELSDGAGIMLSGRQDGTVVEYNYVHDISETSLHQAGMEEFRGLYIDEGGSGITARNNLFLRCHQSYLFHQANRCTVTNNLFIDSEIGGLWMLLNTKLYGDGGTSTYPIDMEIYRNVYFNTDGAKMYHLSLASAAYLTSMGNPFADTHHNYFGEDEFLEQINVTSTTRNLAFLQSTYTLETNSVVGTPVLEGPWYMPAVGSDVYDTGFVAFSLTGVGAEGFSQPAVSQSSGHTPLFSPARSALSFHPVLTGT